jgi:hypothetical protein
MPPDEEIKPDRKDGDMQPARGLRNENVVVPHKRPVPEINLQEPQGWERFKRWLKRSGRLTLVAEHGGTEQGKLSIPYPIIAAMVALFIWIAGASIAAVWSFASMSRDLSNLQNTLTNQAIRDAEERKKMQEELMLMQTYLQNDRERIIKLEAMKGMKN